MHALLVMGSVLLTGAGGFEPGSFATDGPMAADYLRILSRFPLYAEGGWHEGYEGRADLGWFGSGASDENGQRTLGNFILVYALLGTDPGYDATVSGVPAEELRRKAAMGLRYWAATHRTGSLPCTNGQPWGHHWQSSWWTSKAMTGATLLTADLSPAEWRDLHRVIADEADHLTSFPVPVGEYADTKSEENAWYSEALAWAVTLLPGHPSADRWLTRYNEFCMNTLSTARDASSETLVEGRPVRQWVVGANIHSDYTIENHGFFHICYQSCPLHSLAWDVYAFRRVGRAEPASTHHHVRDVYRTLLRYYLWDGRFAYLGGKDWPRYAYGLYFMVPGLVVQQVVTGDRVARAIERDRVALLEREQCLNANGSFFSQRFTHDVMTGWPSEWETDCACMLSMAYLLHEQGNSWLTPASQSEVDRACAGVFASRESEQVSVRGPGRFAGVSWKAHGGPVELVFGSPGSVHTMEWQGCGGSAYAVVGADTRQTVTRHAESSLDGGFVACGEIDSCYAAADAPVDTSLRIELSDATTRCARIADPSHPILTRPNRLTEADLRDVPCLDSISAVGSGWTALVRDDREQPAILEARVGEGAVVVCMASAELERTAATPAGGLIGNALAWLREAGPRVGWVRAEETGRQALAKEGVTLEPVRWGALDSYDALFVDKSTGPDLERHWAYIVEFARAGGRVWKLCLQDQGWTPDLLGRRAPSPTLRTDLALVALPDDASFLRIERTVALRDLTVERAEGLRWRVANDILNGNRRTFATATGGLEVEGVTQGGAAKARGLSGSSVSVDGALTVSSLAGDPGFTLLDQADRRFGAGNSLCAEDLLCPYWASPRSFAAGQAVVETVLLLAPGSDGASAQPVASRGARYVSSEAGLCLGLRGDDGEAYVVVVRWASAPDGAPLPALPYLDASFRPDYPHLVIPGLRGEVRLTDLVNRRTVRTTMGAPAPALPAGEARVYRVARERP